MNIGHSMNQEEIMQQLHTAVELHNQGKLEKAEAIYKKVLAVDANNFYALNFCGCILRSKKQLKDACNFLQRAVSIRSDDFSANFNLANVFRDLKQNAKAFTHYKTALEIDSCNPEAWYGFAYSAYSLGDKASAIASYRKAIELKPNFVDAYLNLGNIFLEDGEIEQAIATYRKAIEVKPGFTDAKKFILRCQWENNIREQVSRESYREQMEGEDEAGILIAAYPSFTAIPPTRRSVNSWVEDKNDRYFSGNLFHPVFVNLPWVKTMNFNECSSLQIPEAGSEYLDAVDAVESQNKTLQIRMSLAPVISSLIESISRKTGKSIDVIDVGGWSGNALFLAGFNDSWDIVKSWSVVETSTVCVPAREQLPSLLESLPDGSGGKRNLAKLSFEELDAFYRNSEKSGDLIYSCCAQHYNSRLDRDLDNLLSRNASTVFLQQFPYLVSSNSELNVCEIVEAGQMVYFLCSQKFISVMAASLADKYGYSFKMWSEYVEPKLVFWQPQDGDRVLPKEVKEDAQPLLMKSCCIRFDKLD